MYKVEHDRYNSVIVDSSLMKGRKCDMSVSFRWEFSLIAKIAEKGHVNRKTNDLKSHVFFKKSQV